MKRSDKNTAILLRRQGFSYSDILKTVPVSKGSLSHWLKNIKLDENKEALLAAKIISNRAKFLEYNRVRSKNARLEKHYLFNEAKSEITGLPSRS